MRHTKQLELTLDQPPERADVFFLIFFNHWLIFYHSKPLCKQPQVDDKINLWFNDEMKEQNISQEPWIERVPGGQLFIARLFGISVQAVSKWVKKQVPAERCPEIEKATNGAVTCEDLRPDVDWAYLRRPAETAATK